MKNKSHFEKYLSNEPLSEQELSHITGQLLTEQSADEKRRERWAALLEQEGIYRETPDSHLKPVEQSADSNTPPPSMTIHRRVSWWKVVAVLFLFLGLGWLVYWQQAALTAPQLAEALLKTEVFDAPQTRMGGEVVDEFWLKGKQCYANKQYTQAISYMEQAVAAADQNSEYRYYLGLAYLYDHKAPQAINALQETHRLNPNLYEHDIYWFLALAHLLQNNRDAAIVELKKLAQVPTAYQHKAKDLLLQLARMEE
jgi:tetratricopeptide (TPR) repeat protein